ncbi:MAG: SDR family oxidoreductase [Acidimicrobiia bacterium]
MADQSNVGRVALVTGGTKGLGKGIAEQLLRSGYAVAVCGRSTPDSPIGAGGRTANFHACDLRDPDQVAALIAAVVAEHGRLDLLVNNAGGSPPADAATVSPRFSASIIALNLTAPLVCAQAANAVMQTQDTGGAIVNIASVSGTRPSPGTAAYGAAKAGLINLTKSLAVEWAPKVRVNALVCGFIMTELADMHYGDEAGVAAVAATVPLGRFADASDIANAVEWLASEQSSYVTGASLEIHGGGERPSFLAAAQRG